MPYFIPLPFELLSRTGPNVGRPHVYSPMPSSRSGCLLQQCRTPPQFLRARPSKLRYSTTCPSASLLKPVNSEPAWVAFIRSFASSEESMSARDQPAMLSGPGSNYGAAAHPCDGCQEMQRFLCHRRTTASGPRRTGTLQPGKPP